MTQRPLIAVLGGARETQMVAAWLADLAVNAVVVWARGSDPVPLGLAEAAEVPQDAAAIVDVTHAFDTQTRRRAKERAPHAAYACVRRDLWSAEASDDWTHVDSIAQAVATLPRGARVFAATGRNSLSALSGHDGMVFLRQLTQHDQPTGFDNCTFVFGTAPFDPQNEARLLKELRIDVVLARNIGGAGSFPKLAAARALGLPVVLLRPPARPDGAELRDAQGLASWVAGL